MIYYIMLIAASFLFGSQFMVTKSFEKNNGKTLASSIEFSILYSLFASVIFIVIHLISSGTTFNFNLFSVFMAFGLAVVNVSCSVIGIKALAMGNIAIYSLFMMSGGMIVPFLSGVIFLKESVSVFKIIGMAIMIFALCIPVFFKNAKDEKKGTLAFYLLCVLLFFFNGLSSTFSKLNSVRENATLGAQFTFLTFGIQLVLSIIALALIRAFSKNKNEKTVLFKPISIKLGAAFGAVNGTAFLLSAISAEHVPAVAQYPLITGATIIFSCILSAIIYREKPTKTQIWQIAISFLATILFMF